MMLEPARKIVDIYRTLSLEPLRTKSELDAFYEASVNDARGEDSISFLERNLLRNEHGTFFKTFFFGSRGSGKSTEMSRLVGALAEQFQTVRIDARLEVNPAHFEPHELILAIGLCLVREMQSVIADSESEQDLDATILQEFEDWFIKAEYTTTRVFEKCAEGKVTFGPGKAIEKFVPLIPTLTGSMRATGTVKEELKETRKRLYGDLIIRINNLIYECTELLGACKGDDRQWLFIIEDLDKGTYLDVLQKLVLYNGHIFLDIKGHLICNLPIGVQFGEQAATKPLMCCQLFDTPVYDAQGNPHDNGRRALQEVLAKRVDLALFADGQVDRSIVASGGNIRLLFELVRSAADAAEERVQKNHRAWKYLHFDERKKLPEPATTPSLILEEDVQKAINQLLYRFRMSLGEEPNLASGVTKQEKRDRLRDIYLENPHSDEPDKITNSLLASRLVLAFNGKGRYAVHPLVVELMRANGSLTDDEIKRNGGGLI